MLKLPMDAVIPAESVPEIQQQLQDIADEQVKKLARQIGTAPAEEPYPGYFDDIARLGLTDEDVSGSSSMNPASMYGPDGKPYAPWMVGKVLENAPKRPKKQRTQDEVDFAADMCIKHVTRLREMSPLWDMVQEGIDLKSIQWSQDH